MKWIVVETSVEGTVAEFGPFEGMSEALVWANKNKFPWSHEFLSSVNVRKVANSHEIAGEVYKVTA